MAITTRLIGTLGGGRPSQEFTVGTATVTRTVGSGRWLCAMEATQNLTGSQGSRINNVTRTLLVVAGPADVTFSAGSSTSGSVKAAIAPLD